MAVAAASKLHSLDGQIVLHSCRFHSREPLELEAIKKVWHLSLDVTFSGDGVLAMQLLSYDLEPPGRHFPQGFLAESFGPL